MDVGDNNWIAAIAAQVFNTESPEAFAPPPRDHHRWVAQHTSMLKRSSSVPLHAVPSHAAAQGRSPTGKNSTGPTIRNIQAWVESGLEVEGPEFEKVIGNMNQFKRARQTNRTTFLKNSARGSNLFASTNASPSRNSVDRTPSKSLARSASAPLRVTEVNRRTEAWIEDLAYKERQRELKLEQQRLEKSKQEEAGCTWKPKLGNLGNARAAYMDYQKKTKKEKPTSETEALEQCTFRPKTNKLPMGFRTAADSRPIHERLHSQHSIKAEKRKKRAAEEEERLLSECTWHSGKRSSTDGAMEEPTKKMDMNRLGNIAERADRVIKDRNALIQSQQNAAREDDGSSMVKPTKNRLSIIRQEHFGINDEDEEDEKVFSGWFLKEEKILNEQNWEKATFWMSKDSGLHVELEKNTETADILFSGGESLEVEHMINAKARIFEGDQMVNLTFVSRVSDGKGHHKSFAFKTSEEQKEFQTVIEGLDENEDDEPEPKKSLFAQMSQKLFADPQEEKAPEDEGASPVRQTIFAAFNKMSEGAANKKTQFAPIEEVGESVAISRLKSIRPSRKTVVHASREAQESKYVTSVRYSNRYLEVFQSALGGEELSIVGGGPDEDKEKDKAPACDSILMYASEGRLRDARTCAGGGKINFQRPDDGMTALMISAQKWDCHFIDWLLTHHANVSARDAKEKSALHHAAMAMHVVPESEADPERGWTLPQKHINWIVKRILNEKAHVDERDDFQCTPLILASANGVLESVRSLITCRAAVNAEDASGANALSYAQEFGYAPVEEFLREKGAKVIARSTNANAGKVEDGPRKSVVREAIGNYIREAKAEPGRILGAGRTIFVRSKESRKTKTSRNTVVVQGIEVTVELDDEDEEDDGLDVSPEAVEKRKEKAKKRLTTAQGNTNANDIRAAIARAKLAGLGPEDLKEAEELLELYESSSMLGKNLDKAVQEKDVIQLQKLIPRAYELGHVEESTIQLAEKTLREELPKYRARQQIGKAKQSENIEDLRAAVANARTVGLPEYELKEILVQVEQVEAKINARAAIQDLMVTVQKLDMENLDRMRDWRSKITAALREGKRVGLGEDDMKTADLKRRQIHNAIEDLKGSIRVFCRVRPMSKKELERGDTPCVKCTDVAVEIDHQHNARCGCPKGNMYTFDSVFSPGTQPQVFDDCIDLVQSVFDGFNITIFAYGQTGAGKTWTMNGKPTDPEMRGVSPRTMQEMFNQIEKKKDRADYRVIFSMVELYRQDCIDLLRPKDIARVDADPLNVRLDKEGSVVIDGVIEREVFNTEELMGSYDYGMNMRSVAATAMNSESSRSHLILIIRINSKNKTTGEVLKGKILICDLAGSERLKKSEVTGDGQKEAIEINKSLTALGDVMFALTDKKKGGIPYRNHKLTQVMQDSLGGSAKTLMFMNCSPSVYNLDETIMSLKWAMRAKKVTNVVSKNRG